MDSIVDIKKYLMNYLINKLFNELMIYFNFEIFFVFFAFMEYEDGTVPFNIYSFLAVYEYKLLN